MRHCLPGARMVFGLLLSIAGIASAQEYDAVVGIWQVTTQMGAQNNESTLTVSVQDGELRAQAGSERGAIPAQDVAFTDGKLSWAISLRGQKMPVEVTVDGDSFEGSLESPLGALPVTGRRVTEEDLKNERSAVEALVGDWEVLSEYDGNTIESKMRISIDDEDGDIEATIIGPGVRVSARRVEVRGDTLRMVIGFPFISTEPAFLVAELVDNTFEGTVKSVLGDIPIRGELVDVSKLVVAPYDDPAPILGAWDYVAHVDGADHPGVITFLVDGPFLKAKVETADGMALNADSVEYKQVGDTMGVIRFSLDIPDLGSEAQVLELIVNGTTFEGEELHSNGAFYMEGEKQG